MECNLKKYYAWLQFWDNNLCICAIPQCTHCVRNLSMSSSSYPYAAVSDSSEGTKRPLWPTLPNPSVSQRNTEARLSQSPNDNLCVGFWHGNSQSSELHQNTSFFNSSIYYPIYCHFPLFPVIDAWKLLRSSAICVAWRLFHRRASLSTKPHFFCLTAFHCLIFVNGFKLQKPISILANVFSEQVIKAS